MAVMLLTGAGLLIETLSNLHAVDLGFPSHNLLTMSTPLSPQIYNTDPKILSFSDRIIASVSKLPGVRAVGFASNLPFTSIGNTNGFQIEGRAASSADQFNDALYREVSNNYLQTLGARLIAGRLLDGRDAANSPRAVVINQTFANRYWPGQSPLGARLSIGGTNRDSALRTVVGVIADIRERGFQLNMKPAMYLPFPQVQQPDARFLLVRTETDPMTLTDAVRKAIWSVDPEQPVAVVRTMDQYIDEEIQGRAHEMKVFATFATLAVFLAALGIYGVLAYSVAQRRREIGVRLVLGATRVAVTGLVLRQGLLLTVIGLGVGSMFAAAATQAMRSMLYGVKPLDPAIYLEGAAILLLAGLTASMLPTISASRVDPASILRDE
jgi:predicted permease